MLSSSSSGPSPSASSSAYALAALVGVATTFGLRMQQRHQRNLKSRRRKSNSSGCGGGGGGDDTSADTTVSVEGSVMVTLPTWAIASSSEYFSRRYTTDAEMMSLAIHLSDRNVSEGTGGPFGSAIFERHASGGYCTLVSIGMNRVVPLGNSTLHGEMVAIQLAQRKVGSFTLRMDDDDGDNDGDQHSGLFYDDDNNDGKDGERNIVEESTATCTIIDDSATPSGRRERRFELFTSCEPCAMCLGATLWSGASRIVCGATKEDAQSIGFDEGPVYERSYEHLKDCGVEVTRNVLTEEAASVLRRYGNSGVIYNR